MHIDLLCCADAATVDASGKLNLLGVYDVVIIPAFPGVTRVVTAFRLVGVSGDAGAHELTVTLVDADGVALAKTPLSLVGVTAKPKTADRFALATVVTMAPTIPSLGDYSVDLFVDGRQIGSYPLRTVGAVGDQGRPIP